MNADGTFQKNISNSTTNEFNPVWSPNSNKIAFQSSRDKTTQIYTMNSDGSEVKRFGDLQYNNSNPLWSPDGTKIVCSSTKMPDFFKNSLIDLNTDSSIILKLDYSQNISFVFDDFTKGGANILYNESLQRTFLTNSVMSSPPRNIYLYNIATGTSSQIEKNTDNLQVLGFTSSSDSVIILEGTTLYSLDINKKKRSKIVSNADYADYSATNNLIAFISNQKLYTIKLDGADKKMLKTK